MRHYGVGIPNNMASDRTFDDLNLSRDEVKRLGEALKDEQFRKLLVEYAEEISNPENRRKAEEEIAMLENERGMNVQFIHPQPGYVLKTTVNGTKKAFINICQNEKLDKPKSKKQTGPNGKNGLMWQIPHSFAPPKEDFDKNKKLCEVYDVVFHPDTYRMAMSNERFKKLVEDTALDGIERQFGVTLDKKNIKRPKLKFKGKPTATIMRERKGDGVQSQLAPDDILNQMPYPYDSKTSSEKALENEVKNSKKNSVKSENAKNAGEDSKFTEPKYTLTHRSELDLSEYRNAPDAKTSTRPKELVIKIELPLLKTAAQANLDIFEKRLVLTSVAPAAYKLDLALPFPVNEDDGSAKFDKTKKTLTVTLPVIPDKTPPLPYSDVDENKSLVTEVTSSDVDPGEKSTENKVEKILLTPEVLTTQQTDETQSTAYIQEKEEIRTNTSSFPQNVKWILPDYQFSQDRETVSFIVTVKNVEAKSIKLSHPSQSVTLLQLMSYGTGCFPVYYSLYVRFSEDCCISPEHSNLDISADNVVLVVLKEKSSRGIWDSFEIGIDESQLQYKQFLTESNLQRELSELDKEATEEANMPIQVEMMPSLSVVTMNEHKLTIDIKPPKGKKQKSKDMLIEDEDEEYDPPTSAEIQVIHKHPTPNLHSILKTRTPSESSEEVMAVDPESPRSESDELSSSFSKKRSVSFSNHVDHASFKSFASVSSMTPALKSKRRRQRKRDEKRQGRVRRTSEGNSSSEECLHSGDSYSLSEGEITEKGSNKNRMVLCRAVSDPGPNIYTEEFETKPEEKKKKKKGKNGKKKEEISGDSKVIPHSENGLDFRTSNLDNEPRDVVDVSLNECQEFVEKMETQDQSEAKEGESTVVENGEKSASKRNKKIIAEIKNKMAGGDASRDVDDKGYDSDDYVEAVSLVADELSEKAVITSATTGGDGETPGSKHNGEKDVDDEERFDKKEKNSDQNKSDGGSSSVREKSDVETMLSWEEEQINGEHVTQCAFEFTNSMMYDLDVD
ncbi:protein kintoun-like [Physella acuta]|uniref:protein kintoun-like n=1 Tax=Physella acuta TaxID=109671 RepID=UPI0027DE6EB6|nr:protein kintoun-like [Physella acuta]